MPWDYKVSRRLKLKDLQTLMAVIEAGGMGKAADRLNYSQPAVSKAIAGLERTLGKRLFERGRKGIELTPYGDAMLKCGTAVFDDLKRGVEELDFISDPTAGEVRIGCSVPVSMGIVSAVVDRVARRYPRIVMDIVTGQPPELYSDLDARKVDFVIVRISEPVAEDHRHTEILYRESVVVVAGLQHPCARKRRVELADIADEHWALPPANSLIHILVTEAFRSSGLGAPRISAIVHNPHLGIILASRGHLLTVVPDVMLRTRSVRSSIKALPIELSRNRRPVGIVSLKKRPLSPVAQLFIEHARSFAKSMTKD